VSHPDEPSPDQSNPAQSNPAQSNPAQSNPDQSNNDQATVAPDRPNNDQPTAAPARPPVRDGFDDGLGRWLALSARVDTATTMATWAEVRPDLCDSRGRARVTVVAYAFDAAVGMIAGIAALPNWVVTIDLAIRALGPVTVGPVRVESEVRRVGRSQVLVEGRAYDQGDGDRLVAIGTGNHAVLVPEGGAPMPDPVYGLVMRQADPWAGETRPDLPEQFGVVRTGVGAAVLPMDTRTRNPWGILHGALYVLLAEEAVATLPGGPWILSDLDLRFMAPVRTGPAAASATIVDATASGAIARVEVRDGLEGRLCGLILAAVLRFE
jgi:acyl-coenzyme A thioesterase PaaI-like protein